MAEVNAIDICNLSFSYGGAPVLLDVSAEIPPKSRVVLTGPRWAPLRLPRRSARPAPH